MYVPVELKYSKEHEWIKVEGNKAYIGITDFAQHCLGDIVFVELPELDSEVNAEDTIGTVESVKAASDMHSPVSGTIVEINEELSDSPDKVNAEPYESWFFGIELKDQNELNDLMSAEDYEKFCQEQE